MPVLLGGGFIVLLLVVWQLAVSLGLVNSFLTSSPLLIAQAIGRQAQSGTLLAGLATSAVELALGFGLAAVGGVLAGLLMGRYRWVEFALEPYVWVLYSAPIVALFPLLVLVFGLGTPAVTAIAFLMAVVPIVVNASQAVRNVDQKLVSAAVSFGAGETSLLAKVILPASVPTVMAGLRLGLGRALVGVVIGEFFAGDGGIGYDISYYAGHLGTTDVLAAVVVVIVVGLLLNGAARWVERRADSWRTDPNQ
jgi:NitT/TauT family transport system permease protein